MTTIVLLLVMNINLIARVGEASNQCEIGGGTLCCQIATLRGYVS